MIFSRLLSRAKFLVVLMELKFFIDVPGDAFVKKLNPSLNYVKITTAKECIVSADENMLSLT